MPGLAQSVLNYGRGALAAAGSVAKKYHGMGMTTMGGTAMGSIYGSIAGGLYGATIGRDPGQSRLGGFITGAFDGGFIGAGIGRYGPRALRASMKAVTYGRASPDLKRLSMGIGAAGRSIFYQVYQDAINSYQFIGNTANKAVNRVRSTLKTTNR